MLLNVDMLSAVELTVFMQNVAVVCIVMLIVFMLNNSMLNVVILSVIMQNVAMVCIVILSVFMSLSLS